MKQRNKLSAGLIVGALSGAVAAYFLAPQTGAETKKMLAKKANSLTQTSILHVQNQLIHLERYLEEEIIRDEIEREMLK